MSNSESSQKFKIGDTVQLKSGGPIMTIKSIDESGIRCQWFAGEHFDKVESHPFPPDSLKLVVE